MKMLFIPSAIKAMLNVMLDTDATKNRGTPNKQSATFNPVC